MFELRSDYKPTGDQPKAIIELTDTLKKGGKHQVLLGVTGSGKTFTIANVIQNIQRPTLVLSHNKTLAAQLYQEFKEFFPKNAVEYFVSYYDYYQPESYLPATDTYIEKDADINEKIDRLRLSATTSLMTRKDVIVVSSVSCIYNLGSPAEYSKMAIELKKGMKLRTLDLLKRLSQIYYERNEYDFIRGSYRVRGDIVDVFPAYLDIALRLEILDNTLMEVNYFDPITGDYINYNEREIENGYVQIYPAKHYVTEEEKRKAAFSLIEQDLKIRLHELRSTGKELEAYRLEQRTRYDLEMLNEIGYCKGIENYSRYFDGRNPGDPPYSLMDFFPKDYLLVVDESHITIPQVRGMYNGDRSRKQTLIEYGFRLPSAYDNRPLNFEEFLRRTNQVIFVSATPADWEISMSEGKIAQQLIRPTGIVDPTVNILPTQNQIKDLIGRIRERVEHKQRVLVTTLTKRMAEELSTYLLNEGIKVTYLHSDIETLERTNILDELRKGNYDVLVGINLLREGLDLPEVSLVAILDADKEGFLRSETSLIQTMGRAARHILGEVAMYADSVTKSMEAAIKEVNRRRDIQLAYNKKYHITPTQIEKPIREKLIDESLEEELNKKEKTKDRTNEVDYFDLPPMEIKKELKKLEKLMKFEAEMLNFEKAAEFRDRIRLIRRKADID
ncbi:excinuclease ABC subunit B [candidate division WWE3 bacterium RBG_19FT_COMBO_34_6]|uniref:UvrABC system protein B n=1 Tax=candidate division WWE3 bacterium RBG_19FT_COMBO_34_6 TaxID=1802612 RepID=A0A1F4UKS9_UNCKA|nr:MAG: excinuclease ABC subunit B [candidate division WWE3 bacterium RBG_19FT_COMBO_34_6]